MVDKLRLVICVKCGSVQEIPDYEGHWQQDIWLNETLKSHLLPSGEATHGEVHVGRVGQSEWNNSSSRQQILARLPEEVGMPGSGQGLGQTYYDTKSNFTADAFTCWTRDHNRTTNCEDYKSDRKRLWPDTKGERKELGLDPKTRPNTFLCDFCPYNSIVMQRQRASKGEYDYTN